MVVYLADFWRVLNRFRVINALQLILQLLYLLHIFGIALSRNNWRWHLASMLRIGEWVAHGWHHIGTIITFVDDHAAAPDHEVFVAVGDQVLDLCDECIAMELLRHPEALKVFAAQSLHQGLILKLHSLELPAHSALTFDRVICIALEAYTFLLQFLALRNINLVMLMNAIYFLDMILGLLLHLQEQCSNPMGILLRFVFVHFRSGAANRIWVDLLFVIGYFLFELPRFLH